MIPFTHLEICECILYFSNDSYMYIPNRSNDSYMILFLYLYSKSYMCNINASVNSSIIDFSNVSSRHIPGHRTHTRWIIPRIVCVGVISPVTNGIFAGWISTSFSLGLIRVLTIPGMIHYG